MSKGYVYVLTNPAMPGFVKIGRTTGEPEQRAQQLYSTGVPMPFVVSATFYTPDCIELEAICHGALADCRVDGGREFFKIPLVDVCSIIDQLHRDHVECWLEEYLPDYTIVHPDLAIDPGDLAFMASQLNVPDPVITAAFSVIAPEEMMVFVQRFQDKMAKPFKAISE